MEFLENQTPIAAFQSNGFRYPFWLSLFVVMQLGLLAMFASFAIGVPVFVSVAFMFVAIILGIGLLGGYTSYALHKEGIIQEVKSFNWMPVKMRPTKRSFPWSDIKSYKMGSDLSRSMQLYNYLYIDVRKMPYQLRLSDDQSDKVAFQQFAEAFEKALVQDSIDNKTFGLSADEQQTRLLRKPDFYHTKFAHILFWFFMAVIGMIAFAIYTTGNLKSSYVWRFSVIIIPGMSYMAYRLYGRGRQE